ncbi:MAG TPA: tetratricopeptide repeat protein [Xanthobacteraceae bacterium]|nr:tetratricopeptide repeat protein [Xanthobacteraceae bacterium]
MRCFVIVLLALLLPGLARAEVADAVFRNGLTAFNEGRYARAQEAWTPLAKAGDARAQTGLGFMYYSGRGVPRDSVRAAEFFRLAAEQGEPTAQLFLALMHFKSDGVPMNAPLAMMWAELAMAGGQTEAFQWRGIIMQSMTEAEREEAWRLLARWRETHRK